MRQHRPKHHLANENQDRLPSNSAHFSPIRLYRDPRYDQHYYRGDFPPPVWNPMGTSIPPGQNMPYYMNGHYLYGSPPRHGLTRTYPGFPYPRETYVPHYPHPSLLANGVPPPSHGPAGSLSNLGVTKKKDRGTGEKAAKNYVCPVPGCFMVYLQEKHLNLHMIGHKYDNKFECHCIACESWHHRQEMIYAAGPQYGPEPCQCPDCVPPCQRGPQPDNINDKC